MALYRHKTDQKLMDQAQQYQDKLHHLTAHLQSIREDERTRIAREIHDDLGQSLTALKIDLSWLKKRIGSTKNEIHMKLKAMSAITDHLLQSVKRISTELRPGLLDDLGLAAAMEWQANEFSERTGIQCNLMFKPKEIEVEEPLVTPLFRIFQEALTNTARHAGATKVNVELESIDDSVELTITDNGRGITDKEINDPKAFGIMGIRERTSHLGGRLDIKGNRKIGTTISVRLPHQMKRSP
jgi:signal transduction histidine kinase